jgi:hypothetical protein
MNMPAGLMFAVDYSQPQFVRVRVDRVAGLAADFNGDGIVDAGDLAQWRNNFGVDADAELGRRRFPRLAAAAGQ